MKSVEEWLAGAGLPELADIFLANDVGLDIVSDLSDADLREMGLNIGQRKRFARAVATLAGPRQAQDVAIERRRITAAFIDLVESTSLSARHDVEDFRDIIRAFQEACSGTVRGNEGAVVQYLGDGILATFGGEHAAENAVRAGLACLSAVHDLEPIPGTRVAARCGIATGLTVMGQDADEMHSIEPLGETLNLAARLQTLAEPGTVVISAATHDLTAAFFRTERMEPAMLKGFSDPITAYKVMGEADVESRFHARSGRRLSALAGRDGELKRLVEMWDRSKAGSSQVVLVKGEPGSGKSRLLAELEVRIGADDPAMFHLSCHPGFLGNVLHSVTSFLRRRLELAADASPPDAFRHVRSALESVDLDAETQAPLFASILGIPAQGVYYPPAATPAQQRRAFAESCAQLLAAFAGNSPALITFEDLHWADPSTFEFLGELGKHLENRPFMLLATSRPGTELPEPLANGAAVLELGPLPALDIEAIVRDTCEGRWLPGDILAQIAARVGGNPLFTEEITKSLIHSGKLRPQGGRLIPVGGVGSGDVPASLQDALAARLDALPETREIAQVAAAIGREFEPSLVALALDRPLDEVLPLVLRLEAAEIVDQLPGHHIFQFRHALLQDAIYESLLRRRRQPLHSRLAALLEAREEADGPTPPEVLAHHLSRAGEYSRAIGFGQQAAVAALMSSANAEVIHHAQSSLEWLEELDPGEERTETELAIHSIMTPALMAMRGYASDEVEASAQRAFDLLDELGHRPEVYPSLFGLSLYRHVRSDRREAREMAERYLSVASSLGNTDEEVAALPLLGHCQWIDGETDAAVTTLTRTVDAYDIERHGANVHRYGMDPFSLAKMGLSQLRWSQGYATEALAHAEEALEHTRRLGHANSIGLAMLYRTNAHAVRGERDRVAELAHELQDYCTTMGVTTPATYARIVANWANGEIEDSLALFEVHDAVGAQLGMTYYRWLTAGTALESGDIERARAILAPALEQAEKTGEIFWEPGLLSLRARIDAQTSAGSGSVRASLDKALERARAMGTRMFEALTLIDLIEFFPDDAKSEEYKVRLVELVRSEGVELPRGALTPDLAAVLGLPLELHDPQRMAAGA